MKSSISATGASPSAAPPTRSITVILTDGSRLRVTCRDLAAQLRQERSAALRRLRQARAEAKAEVADRIGEARIRRELEASEREMDAAIRRLSKQVRVRPEARRSSSTTRLPRSRPIGTGHSGITLTRSTASALARHDSLGREGIMLRIRYVRAGGKHAGPGCLRRHWRYIAREAAVTLDSDGRQIVLSNLGNDIDAVADVLGLQEQVLREMRKNAKLGFRMVGAFPFGMPVDARRAFLQRLGDELFGARDLPWSAAAHDADPAADVDNPHFHFDYGLLSMARQSDGSFVVSNDLRTDLDGQEGLRFIRHTVARVMTEVAQEHGLDRTFTALSYRERGMDREGGEHIGQEGTAAHRRGEHVAAIARNEAKGRLAEARERARRARERLDALERLKRAVTASEAAPLLEVGRIDTAIGATAVAAAPAVADQASLTETLSANPAPAIQSIDAASVTTAAPAPRVGDILEFRAASPSEAPIFRSPPQRDALPLDAPVMTVPTVADAGTVALTMAEVPLIAFSAPAPSSSSAPALAAVSPAIDNEATPNAVLPTILDVGDCGPAMAALPFVAFLPPPPALLSAPPSTALLPAIDGKDTPVLAEPPHIVTLTAETVCFDAPPVVSAIGSVAPAIPTAASVAAIGFPPPRMVAPVLPHADTRLAPVVEAVPALIALDLAEARGMALPPGISRLGSDAPRLAEVPSLWRIGRKVSDDAVGRDTARRVEQLLEEEEARRRNGGPVPPNVNAAHVAAFEMLRLRDEWTRQDEQGRYTVSEDALRAIGLSRADLGAPAAQAALEAIGMGQIDRLGPVIDDLSRQPPFHIEGGAIRLNDRFAASLREDVTRWSGDPHFRAFVGRVWPRLNVALEAQPVPAIHPAAVAEADRSLALARLFTAIIEERHLLMKHRAAPVVDPVLLERFGVTVADLAGDDARKRLATIAERQTVEVSQIATYVRQAPHNIVPDGEGWLLDDAAPTDIRKLVAAWRNDATMQRALGRAAGPRPGDGTGPPPDKPGAAWRRARASRETAMAKSDAVERLDGTRLDQPGRSIERPGSTRRGVAVPIARRFPGLADPGIGG